MRKKHNIKKILKKTWHFIWEDDSIWSWLANVVLAFVVIKFLLYPLLGLIFQTAFPVVAVVSESMEHNGLSLDEWYDQNEEYYLQYNITQSEFEDYKFKNGFNKGDIMVLLGKKAEKLERGDTIVFFSKERVPIIHRVIKKWKTEEYYFQTKGDNNPNSIALYTRLNQIVPKGTPGAVERLDETEITEDEIVGKAVFKVPWLGYIKIWFVDLMRVIGIIN